MTIKTMAVVGDVHGDMIGMIALIDEAQKKINQTIDFVLQVGDFEPHRHNDDLMTMAAPSKYRQMGSFYKFYNGSLRFPWPVFFIGGNHEPYGFLDYYLKGSEICPNCTYLGRAFSGEIQGIKVCALSGVYSEEFFEQPLPPVERFGSISNKKYIYFRESHVESLLDVQSTDIMIIHEWPTGVIAEKDQPEFEQQRRSLRYDSVGNEYSWLLIEHLNPSLVIAGHMHKSYRSTFHLENKKCLFTAFSKVADSQGAVGVFQIHNGLISEIE